MTDKNAAPPLICTCYLNMGCMLHDVAPVIGPALPTPAAERKAPQDWDIGEPNGQTEQE